MWNILFFAIFVVIGGALRKTDTQEWRLHMGLFVVWVAYHISAGWLDLQALMAVAEMLLLASGPWNPLRTEPKAKAQAEAQALAKLHEETLEQAYRSKRRQPETASTMCSLDNDDSPRSSSSDEDSESMADGADIFNSGSIKTLESDPIEEGSGLSDSEEEQEEEQDEFEELDFFRTPSVDRQQSANPTSPMGRVWSYSMGRQQSVESCGRSLASFASSWPPLPIMPMPKERMAEVIKSEVSPEIRKTLTRMLNVVSEAQGGCAIAVAPRMAFHRLKKRFGADYQVVDRSEQWPKGYMSTRLYHRNVHEPEFQDIVREFTEHTDDDRWPANHEAAGQPKDGFMALLDANGECLKCAVRLLALPLPPFCWDGVGTRHLAGLSLAWALRGFPAAVLIRSDSGPIHLLLPQMGAIRVFKALK